MAKKITDPKKKALLEAARACWEAQCDFSEPLKKLNRLLNQNKWVKS